MFTINYSHIQKQSLISDLLFIQVLKSMHELGIAVQIVESAISSIPSCLEGQPVEKLTLDIGKMVGVTVDSLRFCLEIVSKGTFLETAELIINEIPVTAECRVCQTRWTIIEPEFLCKKCFSPDIGILTGRELIIRSIEVREKNNGS